MAKLFRDVDYYVVQASNSTQREFELDFADVIHMYDVGQLELMTEDNKCLVLSWDDKGYFKSYFVDQETSKTILVNQVIETLREIDVDGETLHYILEKVGMTDQVLRQLVMNNPYTDTSDLLEEKTRLSDEYLRSLAKNN